MGEHEKRPYRINYQEPDGTTGSYYVVATNRLDALADFRLRTNHDVETVCSVEVRVGNEWKPA